MEILPWKTPPSREVERGWVGLIQSHSSRPFCCTREALRPTIECYYLKTSCRPADTPRGELETRQGPLGNNVKVAVI